MDNGRERILRRADALRRCRAGSFGQEELFGPVLGVIQVQWRTRKRSPSQIKSGSGFQRRFSRHRASDGIQPRYPSGHRPYQQRDAGCGAASPVRWVELVVLFTRAGQGLSRVLHADEDGVLRPAAGELTSKSEEAPDEQLLAGPKRHGTRSSAHIVPAVRREPGADLKISSGECGRLSKRSERLWSRRQRTRFGTAR